MNTKPIRDLFDYDEVWLDTIPGTSKEMALSAMKIVPELCDVIDKLQGIVKMLEERVAARPY